MGKKDDRKKRNQLKKDREREASQRQWNNENARIVEWQKKAPHIKKLVRSRGCDLPFYDFLDSYESEFQKLINEYSASLKSLVGIIEVDINDFDSNDWTCFGGCANWQQVFYKDNDELAETYGERDKLANLRGHMTPLRDQHGEIHTLVRIPKNLKCRFQHHEYKYGLKLPVLLHEIGHVIDIESSINFDSVNSTCNIIEAEVFAHRYALEQCIKRGYRQSYIMWVESWKAYVDCKDYRGEVARRMLGGISDDGGLKDWCEYFTPPNEAEWKMIGPTGVRLLAG